LIRINTGFLIFLKDNLDLLLSIMDHDEHESTHNGRTVGRFLGGERSVKITVELLLISFLIV